MHSPTRAKRLLGRAIAPIAVVLAVGFSLTYTGSDWFEQLKHWTQETPRTQIPREVARTGPIGAPITVTPMRPLGNDSSVSPVPLPLILVRTQPGRNAREGFAQIGVNALSPQTYAAGALLANGTRLTEVYQHYVVLERDGHSVRLYLQGKPQPDAESAKGLLTVGGSTTAPAPVAPNSHDSLTAFVRPSPVFVGNELHGYALYPAKDPTPFSRLGLESGDVVTGIDGIAITKAADSLATLRTLADGVALTVMIERQGKAQTLSLDGAILARAIAAAREAASLTTAPRTALRDDFKVAPAPLTGRSGL